MHILGKAKHPLADKLRAEMRNDQAPEGYVALAWYPKGQSAARLLASNGKIILYDTVAVAQQHIPQLGGGRLASWSASGEVCCFTPIDPNGINRIDIVTKYDPYDLPANFADGILSETHGKEWKRHVMWSYVFFDVGQFEKQADGSFINAALGSVR
jgi:hypothetical protein